MKVLSYHMHVPHSRIGDVANVNAALIDAGYMFRNDFEAYLAWTEYSDEASAGWLNPSPEQIEQFVDWIGYV